MTPGNAPGSVTESWGAIDCAVSDIGSSDHPARETAGQLMRITRAMTTDGSVAASIGEPDRQV